MQSVTGFVDGSVAETFIFATTFCICWFFWPLLLARLDNSTSDVKLSVPTGKACNVFSRVDLDLDDVSTQADESEECLSSDSEFEECPSTAQATTFSTGALFEHYGLFGASPATWCQNHAFIGAEEVGDETDGEEVIPSMATSCHLKATDLFEHYGLFGASPGAWSGSAIDTSMGDRKEEYGSDDSHEGLASASMLFEHYGLFGASPNTWARQT